MKTQTTPPKNLRRGPLAEGIRLRDIDIETLVRQVRNLVECARDERVRRECEPEQVLKTIELVMAAVRARGELLDGGDVPPSDLAALASVGTAYIRQLMRAGVLRRSQTGGIVHRDATRWIARYAFEEYSDTTAWITPSWMIHVLHTTLDMVARFLRRTVLPEGTQFEREQWHYTYRLRIPKELRLSRTEIDELVERVRERLELIDAVAIERERRFADLL